MATKLTSELLKFFHTDANQPRKFFDIEELRKLHDSLVKKQLVPLLAMPGGKIIDGERRWRAAMLDGKPERLDVIITDEPLMPAQITEIQIVSALHRADLKPYEQFLGCRDWLALNPGATAKDLATKIDRDPSTLVRILSLSRCIPAVQVAAADGKVGPSEWYAISKVLSEAEQQAMLAAKLAGASRDQLEQRGRKLRTSEAPGIKVNKLKIPLGQEGRSVTIAGSNLSLDDAIEMLQETLKFARKPRNELMGLADLAQEFEDRLSRGSDQPANAPEKDKNRGIDGR